MASALQWQHLQTMRSRAEAKASSQVKHKRAVKRSKKPRLGAIGTYVESHSIGEGIEKLWKDEAAAKKGPEEALEAINKAREPSRARESQDRARWKKRAGDEVESYL